VNRRSAVQPIQQNWKNAAALNYPPLKKDQWRRSAPDNESIRSVLLIYRNTSAYRTALIPLPALGLNRRTNVAEVKDPA
jgi:hypothetical protein